MSGTARPPTTRTRTGSAPSTGSTRRAAWPRPLTSRSRASCTQVWGGWQSAWKGGKPYWLPGSRLQGPAAELNWTQALLEHHLTLPPPPCLPQCLSAVSTGGCATPRASRRACWAGGPPAPSPSWRTTTRCAWAAACAAHQMPAAWAALPAAACAAAPGFTAHQAPPPRCSAAAGLQPGPLALPAPRH